MNKNPKVKKQRGGLWAWEKQWSKSIHSRLLRTSLHSSWYITNTAIIVPQLQRKAGRNWKSPGAGIPHSWENKNPRLRDRCHLKGISGEWWGRVGRVRNCKLSAELLVLCIGMQGREVPFSHLGLLSSLDSIVLNAWWSEGLSLREI